MERGESEKQENINEENITGLVDCWSGRDFKLKVYGPHGLVYGS